MISAHEAGIVSLQVSCDGDVISDAVIFEYKNNPNKRDSNDVVTNDADVIDDDDSLSLVWECGNICNSYLCETETCRRALRATLLQRMEELEKKLLEQDVRNTGQEKKVKIFSKLKLFTFLIDLFYSFLLFFNASVHFHSI